MTLAELNALAPAQADGWLRQCCGATRWARMMAAARPFASREAMAVTADVIWSSLDRADWLEAFAAHPKIGQSGPNASTSAAWSKEEQSGVAPGGDAVREGLARVNRAYEGRFGYIFIVCATGRSGAKMLALAERRMRNDPESELAVAAEEQRQITRLRLARLGDR